MKYSVLLIVMLSAVLATADEFYEGIHGGMTMSSASLDKGDDPEALKSFMFGIFLDRPISDNTAWSFGINYSRKGYKQEENDDGDGLLYDRTHRYSYITLPLQFKLTSSRDEATNFFIGGGISTNFKVSSTYELEREDGENKDGDLNDVSGLEFSAIFSTGFYINELLKLELRYDLGLTDINNTSLGEDIEVKTRTASILIGLIRVL